MGKRTVFGAFCCAMLLSGSTWAATLEPGQGNLSINQGQGFQPVNSRIDANVGDSVMVSPDGAATIVYDDGCTVDVQPGAVTTIAPLSPCASGSYAQIPPPEQESLQQQWLAYVAAGGTLGFAAWAAYQATLSPSTATAASPSSASP